jgi:hypothetical protein
VDEYRKNAEALYNEANAIDKVGAAAKNAQKHLAGFDELNRLSSTDGGGGASTCIVPDFSGWEDNMSSDGWNVVADLKNMFSEIRNVFVENSDKLNGLVENIGLIWGKLKPLCASISTYFRKTFNSTIDWIIDILYGFSEFLGGVLTGDWDRALNGLVLMFTDTGAFISEIFGGNVRAALDSLSDWIDEVFTEDIARSLKSIIKFYQDTFLAGEQIWMGWIEFLAGVFTHDWERALKGLVETFKGVGNTIVSLINLLLRGAADALNFLFKKLKGISVYIPGHGRWEVDIPPITNPPQIPMLAKGAVLPPNKPFMAMVGDQRNGTNIEAPLTTIEEAVANVMARNSGSMTDQQIVSLLQSILEAVLGIELDGETLSNAVHAYDRKKAVSLGG